jgi:hypothetical protein
MKLTAGTIDGAATEWAKYQYNGKYDKGCRTYFIPFLRQQWNLLYWYIEMSKVPASITFKYIDVCECTFHDLNMGKLLIGINADGNYYAVANSPALPAAKEFVLAAEVVYADNTRQWFFSQVYEEQESCVPVEMLYACYSPLDMGGFDGNGIYYGKAVTVLEGDPEMRYFHNYTLRGLVALYGGRKHTYTSFLRRPTKTESEVTFNLSSEIIPYWYEQYIAEAYARGVVYVSNEKYEISEYESVPVGDACCERLLATAKAVKTRTTTHGCIFEICVPSTCILPDITEMQLWNCKGRELNRLIPVTGTLPIDFTVLDAGGYNVNWQDGQIAISGMTNTLSYITVRMENCAGIVERVITVNAQCCNPQIFGIVGNVLPSANIGEVYNYSYALAGTPPFNLVVTQKPAWMNIAIVGDLITFSGTANVGGIQPVKISIQNECASLDLDLTVDIKEIYLSNWNCDNQSIGQNRIRINGVVGDVVELEVRGSGYFGWNTISGLGASLVVELNGDNGCASQSTVQQMPAGHNVSCIDTVTIPPVGWVEVMYKVLVKNGSSGATSAVSAAVCAKKRNGQPIPEVCQYGACVGTSSGV